MEVRKEGRGWHGDPERHAEAGRKGGETTAKKYGPTFYSEIGRKGGKVSPGKLRGAGRRSGSI